MAKNNRINIIDETRGALIILVILYHLLYDLSVIFKVQAVWGAFRTAHIIQPVLPFMFILISGNSFNLSRNNIKRGAFIGAAALAVTLATLIVTPDYIVLFGILHFLALTHIVFGLLKNLTDKIPNKTGIAICVISALLFILTYYIQNGYLGINGLFTLKLPELLYENNALMIFGFHSADLISSDYVPVLPWIFVFIIGMFLGRYVIKLPESLKRTHIPPLAFIGRHTLIIYIVHQPVMFGVLRLIMR